MEEQSVRLTPEPSLRPLRYVCVRVCAQRSEDLQKSVLTCGGLSEKGPHGFLYLNGLSDVGPAISEGSGGVALLEEVGAGFEISKPRAIPT